MKKVIATILLIVMMIGFLGNCKVQANDSYVVKRELDSVSAKLNLNWEIMILQQD